MHILETLTFLDDIVTEGKVIQLEYKGHPFLVAGRTNQNMDILFARWCESRGMPFVNKRMVYHPAETAGLTIVGAGRCRIPLEKIEGKRTLVCGGMSVGYNLAIHSPHLERVQAALPDWTLIYKPDFYG